MISEVAEEGTFHLLGPLRQLNEAAEILHRQYIRLSKVIWRDL